MFSISRSTTNHPAAIMSLIKKPLAALFMIGLLTFVVIMPTSGMFFHTIGWLFAINVLAGGLARKSVILISITVSFICVPSFKIILSSTSFATPKSSIMPRLSGHLWL